jgi:hypothetical protein
MELPPLHASNPKTPEVLMPHQLTLSLLLLSLLPLPARADEEASNRTYVQSATYGTYYAKSIPAESYGTKGTTRIYLVQEKDDQLVTTFDWYAPQIALMGTSKGCAVVRFGVWARGRKASPDELAIAFYLNGKLLHSYSTLDLAGTPDNVSSSVSHYTIIDKTLGFRWINSNSWAFDIQTTDHRLLSFDPDTGTLLPPSTTAPNPTPAPAK